MLSVEANLEEARQSGDATYSVSRHVDMMIALLAEARLLARVRSRRCPGIARCTGGFDVYMKASGDSAFFFAT